MQHRTSQKTPSQKTPSQKTLGRAPALAALLFSLAAAHAAPATHADPVRQAVWGSRAAVILKLAPGGLTPARRAALQSLGASVTGRFDFIGSVAATAPAGRLARIKALPFVTHLSSDGRVEKCDEFTEASSGADTAFQQYGLTGQGVTVAVVDSGVVSSTDLTSGSPSNRIQAAISFVPGDASPNDACGHGSHVAGIIAGNGSRSSGAYNGYAYTRTFYGVARSANLVNVRVLDQNGQSSVSTVLAGIRWVVAHKNDNPRAPIRVLNLSLGHAVGESYTTDPLCQAVEAAWKSGIVVVCAAGNAGRAANAVGAGKANEGYGTAYGSIQSPANDPYVITVGATKTTDGSRAHDRVATYSSRGPSRLDLILKPDILAPGNKVISVNANGSTLDNYNGGTNDIPYADYCQSGSQIPSGKYFRLSGTSMAAPVVAGAAALLLQANPNLSPDTVKARLMVSADKWASPTGVADPCTYGAGYLNIPAALASTVTTTRPALSPALVADAQGNVSISASGIMSASHIIWGTNVNDLHIIWGTNAVADSGALSASHIIWGTSQNGGVFADHIIWGTCQTGGVDLSSTAIAGEGAAVQTFKAGACPPVGN